MKIHYLGARCANVSLCGIPIKRYVSRYGYVSRWRQVVQCTNQIKKVTCKRCLKMLEEREKSKNKLKKEKEISKHLKLQSPSFSLCSATRRLRLKVDMEFDSQEELQVIIDDLLERYEKYLKPGKYKGEENVKE